MPFRLHYRSDRVPGYQVTRAVAIPLSGATVPPPLDRIDLTLMVAGRLIAQSFPPTTNQSTTFIWDGYDAYGRLLQGKQPLLIRVGYHYPAFYASSPADITRSFAVLSGVPLVGSEEAPQEGISILQEHQTTIGGRDAGRDSLGGWTFSVHHTYDPVGQILYLGTGERRSAANLNALVGETIAGTGQTNGPPGDGGPATQASLQSPWGLAAGPDGSLYIADPSLQTIRRVDVNGIITRVAGGGSPPAGSVGDGGPATRAVLSDPLDVAVGLDGSLYIAEWSGNRLRRVGVDGIITTVAGNGMDCTSSMPCGEGGPAIAASIKPYAIAAAPDGSIYFVENTHARMRRVRPDGTIVTVIGVQGPCRLTADPTCGDGQPVAQASLYNPQGIAVGPEGSIYFTDLFRVRRIGTDGIVTTYAGNGSPCSGPPATDACGEGGPATSAAIDPPDHVAVASDGTVYFTAGYSEFPHVSRVLNGRISTVAGGGSSGCAFGFDGNRCGDGGVARQAVFDALLGIATAPDSTVYVADVYQSRALHLHPGFAPQSATISQSVIASQDGNQLYVFDSFGRHLRTLHALTGAVLFEFGYDLAGHLSEIRDGSGNVTQIATDASGTPTAIVAPFGQQTQITFDANGYLASVTDPAGEATRMAYSSDGLLTTLTDPNNHAAQMTYDELGRLISDSDAAGGSQTLARTAIGDGYEVDRTTALNRAYRYRVENLSTGDRLQTNTLSDGTQNSTVVTVSGEVTTNLADGTLNMVTQGPDPRFAMQSPVDTQVRVSTPAGLTLSAATQRTATLADTTDPFSLTRLSQTVTLNGRTYTSAYTSAQRTLVKTTPMGRQTTVVIDALGRPLEVQSGNLFPMSFGYDANGRLTAVRQGSDSAMRTTTLEYDSAGDLQGITDPMSRSNTFTYDAAGRLLTDTLPDSRQITYGYDADGNLTSLAPPARPVHMFTFTPVNLLAEYIAPDVGAGSRIVYSYNTDRQLTSVTRRDGTTIGVGYDSAGRAATVSIARGTVSYGYDPMTGALQTITAPDGGQLSYTYDDSLVVSAAWAGSVSGNVGYTYDADLRVASLTVNDAEPVTFRYEADSLLMQAGNLTATRDPQTGLVTGTVIGGVAESRSYDGFADLSTLTYAFSGSPLSTDSFTRDVLSRITEKVAVVLGDAHTFDYAYDLAGHLAQVTRDGVSIATYTYDANGNRLSGPGVTAAIYDAQDRLIQYGSTTYAYDAAGALSARMEFGQTTNYTYDELGNLVSVRLPDGTRIEYIIDGQNRRVGKTVNGSLVDGFLYDGEVRPIAELDGTGAIVGRFIYGTRLNVPDYIVRGGISYRIMSDHLGSPRLVVNVTDGTVVERIDYDEFGSIINDTNPGFQPFGFAGGLYDHDTHLIRFGLRDYDPATGRWTTKDPLLIENGDIAPYQYALGDPVNYVDPDGALSKQEVEAYTVAFVVGVGSVLSVTFLGTSAVALGLTVSTADLFGLGGLASAGLAGGGQYLKNRIDPCHQSSVAGAALDNLVGSLAGGGIPVKGIQTLKQLPYFAPMFRNALTTVNGRRFLGSQFLSSVVEFLSSLVRDGGGLGAMPDPRIAGGPQPFDY